MFLRGRVKGTIIILRIPIPVNVVVVTKTTSPSHPGLGATGTNDLLVSNVIRTNEMQVWFVSEDLVDAPLVRADGQAAN